ncbi:MULTISPECIES: SGNH/GDSL hydrolase family protein [Virgibacillus]|uniref:GDSL-like Lipase/Acylhydrolase n=1 Tax=Virgibacillus massiliensis TaxID=1462526 RepID=A0A024Q7C0_9BACI|nr:MULTISPECIES: SGNH/GDSL hydrolase family protein [Virgibacillus]EQB38075.1 hypothetical protein M948_05750 [Virgibacillus sp. CM-4]MYL40792.1 hydrolase [Virgibacillus massiliensis]CDQ38413.1 GDSL-like Lipase/Acylhydrolase [Virgibacillus massiliensis]
MGKKRLLFIGDSITEWGIQDDPERIGVNYVRLIHDYLRITYSDRNFEIINKGIGGNRIVDLAARWEEDVLQLSPDLISISIGINDVWRQLDQPNIEQVFPKHFAAIYEQLIERVKDGCGSKIVLMEPTIIEEDEQSSGNQKLKEYVEIVRRLGDKYDASIVPTHQVFLDYIQKRNGYHLTIDGVHMNARGNLLMAKTWLESAKSTCSALFIAR